MTTIVNTPAPAPAPPQADGGNGLTGIIVGIVLIMGVGFLFFIYGLPAMRGNQNMNTGGDSGPTINVPEKVQIEVKK